MSVIRELITDTVEELGIDNEPQNRMVLLRLLRDVLTYAGASPLSADTALEHTEEDEL